MLRVGVTELNIGFENREEAKKCCLEVMEEASANGVELLVFPEMTLTGFTMRPWLYAESWDADNIPEEELPFGAIRVSWGHGAALTHRDILGSLMAQGVRREELGDLLVGENGCDVIALRECIPFLRDNWLSAGRTGLHPVEIPLSELRIPAADGKTIRDTVASLRMDAVLGSGFSLSRGRAAELIAAGRVSLNGCECLKPDRQLAEGDILSVRGQGRLILREIGGLSKKGRFYITVERFGG